MGSQQCGFPLHQMRSLVIMGLKRKKMHARVGMCMDVNRLVVKLRKRLLQHRILKLNYH